MPNVLFPANLRGVKDAATIALQRIAELGLKLEARAKECPGLYPIRTANDFVRIALDRLETPQIIDPEAVPTLSEKHLDELCHWMESMHHHPETSYQINSLSLIRRGVSGPFTVAGNNDLQKSGS